MRQPVGIVVVGSLMIPFGIAEVATGFSHSFLGLISTAAETPAAIGGAVVGAVYAAGGLLLLTRKSWAIGVALACLVFVVLGRVALVLLGLYPVDSFLQTFSMVVGTTIAVVFAIYVWRRAM